MHEPTPPSPANPCLLEACHRDLVRGDTRALFAHVSGLENEHPWEVWARATLSPVSRLDGQELIAGLATAALVLVAYLLSL